MRIVVASPPRSGNHWTKCLLAEIYGLKEIGGERSASINPRGGRNNGGGEKPPDGSIVHMHSRYTHRLAAELEALPAHLVTAVRDPYDVFLSYYRWVQTRAAKRAENSKKADNRPRSRMVGRPLDDPEVLAYLSEEFGVTMSRGNGWLHSGRAIPVRYEELHADPVGTLRRVSDLIQPVDQTAIEAAVAACQIDTVLKTRPELSRTVRSGKVGESRQHLTEAHLQIFRDRWSDLITSLGYPVR